MENNHARAHFTNDLSFFFKSFFIFNLHMNICFDLQKYYQFLSKQFHTYKLIDGHFMKNSLFKFTSAVSFRDLPYLDMLYLIIWIFLWKHGHSIYTIVQSVASA